MTKKRAIHEAAFRLSYDMGLQIAPKLGALDINLAPQQMRAMRLIWSGGTSTLIELSKTLKRDKGQVARIVDELCKAGMVSREANPNDGRSKILKLTAKGAGVFEAIEAIEAGFSKQLTKGISKQDLATFFAVSDRLSANMRDIGEEG